MNTSIVLAPIVDVEIRISRVEIEEGLIPFIISRIQKMLDRRNLSVVEHSTWEDPCGYSTIMIIHCWRIGLWIPDAERRRVKDDTIRGVGSDKNGI